MAGYVCAIGSGKGGVGKTTVAVNLAVAMRNLGTNVVLVDADLQMANVAAMLDIDGDPGVHGVLCEDVALGDAIVETADGLAVLAGSRSLSAFADADPAGLGGVLEGLRSTYDVVLVDTQTGVSHDVAVTLGRADGTLLVTTPDDIAIRDAGKTATLADRVDGTVIGTVVNFATAETDLAALDERVPAPVLAVLPRTETDPTSRLLVRSDSEPAGEAFERFAERLTSVFSGLSAVEELDPVHDDAWFETDDEDEDDDDEDEVFGLFN